MRADPPGSFEWDEDFDDADSELAAAIELSLLDAGRAGCGEELDEGWDACRTLVAGATWQPESFHPRSGDCPSEGCAARVVEVSACRRTLASALAAVGFVVRGAAEELVDEAAAAATLGCGSGDDFGPGAGPDPAQALRELRLESTLARPCRALWWCCLCRTRHRHPRPDDQRKGSPGPSQAMRLPRRRRVDS